MTATYTAITIGPIIDTLNAARKTRELWGASYLFSYIIKQIVIELKGQSVSILLPEFDDNKDYENCIGSGLFPDRIFMEGEIDAITIYNKTIKETSNKIGTHIQESQATIEDYLKSYFRFIEVHFDCEATDNIIEKGTNLLDSKELETKIIAEDIYVDDDTNPLFRFFSKVNGSFLMQDGFCKRRNSFPSLIEIATRGIDAAVYSQLLDILSKKDEDDAEVVRFLENNKESIHQHHKYIAIVQADGDNVGQIINRIGNDVSAIKAFSKKLMKFSKDASGIVDEYGGAAVYMGGDDMLFFAPLTNKGKNILNLIDDLDKAFKVEFKSEIDQTKDINKKPSVSFGISLSYYKFPLFEAKISAFSALFEDIKYTNNKNAVKIKFRKHSGQMLEWFIKKQDTKLWDKIICFINKNQNTDADFLSSFTHKLRLQDKVFFEKISPDPSKLIEFFKNNYNENYETNKKYYESITELSEIIHQQGLDYQQASALLYSTLKFTHFLRS